MEQVKSLIIEILESNRIKTDRTGVGTVSKFGHMMRFDLKQGFPASTLKRLFWKGVKGELMWFMEGSDNLERLREITFGPGATNKTVWDNNYNNQGKALGYEDGYLGPIYGVQWRSFNGVKEFDQLAQVIEQIKNNPDSRRHLVVAWNPMQVDAMTLPPCHYAFQFEVYNGVLSCMFVMRSNDVFLGQPFNIASYALLTHVVAQICGLEVGELVAVTADTHVYLNHVDKCKEMISRECRPLPVLRMPEFSTLDEFLASDLNDFVLEGYNPHDTISAQMAV